MPKVCFVSISPLGLRAFLLPHILRAAQVNEVVVVADVGELPTDLGKLQGVTLRRVRFAREISLRTDFDALREMIGIFSAEKPDAVVSLHPKAGLLAGLAAWLVRVPTRIHWFTGQVWVTKVGLYRLVLIILDFIVGRLSTHNLVDSPSQRRMLVEKGIIRGSKSFVIGQGSISGIDTSRFMPDHAARLKIREELGIDRSVYVFVFIGRIVRDKGVLDLANAAGGIHKSLGRVHLLFAGPDEEGLQIELESRARQAGIGCSFVGEVSDPERYVQAADTLILPSYREGFGMAVVEAGAAGLPSIVSNIYGLADSVVPGQTGLVYSVGKVVEMRAAMELMILGKTLKRRLSKNALERSRSLFSRTRIIDSFNEFLREAISQ